MKLAELSASTAGFGASSVWRHHAATMLTFRDLCVGAHLMTRGGRPLVGWLCRSAFEQPNELARCVIPTQSGCP